MSHDDCGLYGLVTEKSVVWLCIYCVVVVCLFVVVVPDWNGEASGHFTKGDNVDMIGLQ